MSGKRYIVYASSNASRPIVVKSILSTQTLDMFTHFWIEVCTQLTYFTGTEYIIERKRRAGNPYMPSTKTSMTFIIGPS